MAESELTQRQTALAMCPVTVTISYYRLESLPPPSRQTRHNTTNSWPELSALSETSLV